MSGFVIKTYIVYITLTWYDWAVQRKDNIVFFRVLIFIKEKYMEYALNAIALAVGDETTGFWTRRIKDSVFRHFPVEEIPLDVEQRLATNDACINEFVAAAQRYGSGFKGSTASDDPRIKKRGMGSINIPLRKALGLLGTERVIRHPKRYKKPVGVMRFGSGGFYDEIGCEIQIRDGKRYVRPLSEWCLDDVAPFAHIAANIAKHEGFNLYASSKWTIAESERLFMQEIEKAFEASGTPFGKILTDVGLARLGQWTDGGFLWIFDNPCGDSGSDILEILDGSRSMTSTLYCEDGLIIEELAGGTATDLFGSSYAAKDGKFFNPLAILLGMSRAYRRVNPEMDYFFDNVEKNALAYLERTPDNMLDTCQMVGDVSHRTRVRRKKAA